jgi:hypothetical protein
MPIPRIRNPNQPSGSFFQQLQTFQRRRQVERAEVAGAFGLGFEAMKLAVRIMWGETQGDDSLPKIEACAEGEMPGSVRIAIASDQGDTLSGQVIDFSPRGKPNAMSVFFEEQTMTVNQNDLGVFTALIQRLETQHLPQLLQMKARVDQGERLSEHDLQFLEQVLTDAKNVHPLIAEHPQLDPLASKLSALYREITETALANEKAG